MKRVAIFVDAGYLFAAGAEVLGIPSNRAELKLDHEAFLTAVTKTGCGMATGCELLRVYWYDGTSGRPSVQQHTMGNCANVKLRLGFLNSAGEQKGVDSLIITDMIALARNRAMSDALLVSGDEDLRVGVQQAQEFGVRVHLLGVREHRNNQSLNLVQEADTTAIWGSAEVSAFLTHQTTPATIPRPGSLPATLTGQQALLGTVPDTLAATVPETDLPALMSVLTQRSVPPDWDGKLLKAAWLAVRRTLTSDDKRELRKGFHAACRKRHDDATAAAAKVGNGSSK
jgi:uncharacterized LabA/DUF88 family protein